MIAGHVHTFSVKAMVYGYHMGCCCDGKILPCTREVGNPHDPSSVAVNRGTVVVGHVPRMLSTVCSIFICREGTISCRVNGSWRYSSDLPQGGLEVPCILTFSTPDACVSEKTKKLVESSLALSVKVTVSTTSAGDEKIASSSSGKVQCSTNTKCSASWKPY